MKNVLIFFKALEGLLCW